MAVFEEIPLAKRGGPLVKVQIGPFTYQKMRLEDAIAAGLVVGDGSQKPEARSKNPESRIKKAEAEETPLPASPTTEDVVGEEEEAEPVVKRPKRRPQGRNKMITPEEDK